MIVTSEGCSEGKFWDCGDDNLLDCGNGYYGVCADIKPPPQSLYIIFGRCYITWASYGGNREI